ncbi:MAG: hypothetical protein LBR15_05700 [Methanobrevibacter sp.]|nr:hypothetical protein [Candidatus Methanovirga australis]
MNFNLTVVVNFTVFYYDDSGGHYFYTVIANTTKKKLIFQVAYVRSVYEKNNIENIEFLMDSNKNISIL